MTLGVNQDGVEDRVTIRVANIALLKKTRFTVQQLAIVIALENLQVGVKMDVRMDGLGVIVNARKK